MDGLFSHCLNELFLQTPSCITWTALSMVFFTSICCFSVCCYTCECILLYYFALNCILLLKFPTKRQLIISIHIGVIPFCSGVLGKYINEQDFMQNAVVEFLSL